MRHPHLDDPAFDRLVREAVEGSLSPSYRATLERRVEGTRRRIHECRERQVQARKGRGN